MIHSKFEVNLVICRNDKQPFSGDEISRLTKARVINFPAAVYFVGDMQFIEISDIYKRAIGKSENTSRSYASEYMIKEIYLRHPHQPRQPTQACDPWRTIIDKTKPDEPTRYTN